MLSTKDEFSLFDAYQNDSLDLFSLINFKDILKPIILHPSIKSVCEIDSEDSEKSQLTLWLALLSKIKHFHYCNVNIQLNTIPKFQGYAKLFKENSLNYLCRAEADHDIFLINTNRNYYFLKNALKYIFLNAKQRQSICFLYNLFPNYEKSDFYPNTNLKHKKDSDSILNGNSESNNHALTANKSFFSINTNGSSADTAIKDFLIQNRTNLDLAFVSIPLFYGLGILYSKKIIKEELKELLSTNKIYSLIANEKFFCHIENNRTRLQTELKTAKKKLDKPKKNNNKIKTRHKEFFFEKNYYKKVIEYFFKLINYKHKIKYFKEITDHSTEKKVVFFDFFETLVHRLTKPSTAIRFKTAEFACLKLMHMGFIIDIDKFNKIRTSEEKKFYELNVSRENNRGHFFLIIKNVILNITKKTIEALAYDIIYYEIKNLINTLFIEKETTETLTDLKKQGKLIIACVDNFFSEENIRYIAAYFNINQHIDLCHMFYNRKSSEFNNKLYNLTLKKIQLDANQVLHVSSKYLSNHFSPKKNKIQYLTYTRDNLKKYKNLNVRACNVYNRKLKIKKNYVKKTMHKLAWSEKNLNDFMHLNRNTLEVSNALYPIIAIFAYQIISDLSILHIKKVFFLSKDCDFIKEVFDILLGNISLFKELKNNIQLKVIDTSQIASACLIYTNIENIENFLNQIILLKGSLSIKNLLENVDIALSEFSEKSLTIIKRHYHTIDTQFLTTLIKATDFGSELHGLINTKKKALKEYLSTQGLLAGEKIALIDFLNYDGGIQKNVSHLLSHHQNTEFFGFYFGTNNLSYGKNHFSYNKSTLFPGVIFSNNYLHTANKFNEIFNYLNKLFSSIPNNIVATKLSDKTINNKTPTSEKAGSYSATLQTKLKETIISDTLKILSLFNIANFSSEIAKKYFINNFLNFIKKEIA